jgi:cobalamin biosynthesis Mg chelatase CobN
VIRVRDYKLRSFGYVIRVQDYKLQSLSACLESTLRAVGGHSILEKGHHMKTQNKTKKQTQIENTRERERETHTHTHTHTERETDTKESSMPITGNLQARSPRNLQVGKNLTLECKERERNDLPTRRRWYSVSVLSVVAVVIVVFVAVGRCRRRR